MRVFGAIMEAMNDVVGVSGGENQTSVLSTLPPLSVEIKLIKEGKKRKQQHPFDF